MRNAVSIAMATYNGEKYIKEQLESILQQLYINDEIVISDDGSTDSTLSIIKKINDNRIRIVNGPKIGVKQNFACAISHCRNPIIFLCDQDDVWMPNKVETILDIFEKTNCTCVVHDCELVDSEMEITLSKSFFKLKNSKAGVINNIIRNSYIGCCMAFSNGLIQFILPIPDNIEMHDQWIGLISDIKGKTIFIEDILLKYRRHEENVSSLNHYGIVKMIRNRFVICMTLIRRFVLKK